MLGNIEGRRRKELQRMRWLDNITDAMDMNLGKLWEMVRHREARGAAVHGVKKAGGSGWDMFPPSFPKLTPLDLSQEEGETKRNLFSSHHC